MSFDLCFCVVLVHRDCSTVGLPEAVDNGGADLPESVPVGYDPAAADVAAADSAKADGTKASNTKSDGTKGGGAKNAKKGENGLWQDSTVLDVTGKVGSGDAGLTAVPVN